MSQSTPERSLADEPAADQQASPFGTPNPSTADQTPVALPPAVSIVDTILDLDELMSADVRRAEKTHRLFLEPDREARIDELDAELQTLTDSEGRPLPIAEGQRSAHDVAVELQTEQAAYARSARSIRMRALAADDWDAFLTKHKPSDTKDGKRPPEFWDELIALSAHTPAMTIEQVRALRAKLGKTQMIIMGNDAWEVNVESGVSIPKSPLSSVVLRLAALSRS